MPISGIVIRCADGCRDEVASLVGDIAGIEIHGLLPDGQIVAVIDAPTVEAEVTLVSRLQELTGVVAAQLAYHNFEDLDQERL